MSQTKEDGEEDSGTWFRYDRTNDVINDVKRMETDESRRRGGRCVRCKVYHRSQYMNFVFTPGSGGEEIGFPLQKVYRIV